MEKKCERNARKKNDALMDKGWGRNEGKGWGVRGEGKGWRVRGEGWDERNEMRGEKWGMRTRVRNEGERLNWSFTGCRTDGTLALTELTELANWQDDMMTELKDNMIYRTERIDKIDTIDTIFRIDRFSRILNMRYMSVWGWRASTLAPNSVNLVNPVIKEIL